MAEENPNPYESPKAQIGPPKKDDNYWAPSKFGWLTDLSLKGKLALWGGLLLLFNGITYLFGFWFPKFLIVGVALICATLFVPSEADD
jgi:hypothetical protein